jgi:methylmalonyl-CoA mutase C-terminal domain/subunit
MNRKPRILVGKVGLDGHDVGARIVARALADAGMEVIYTGLRQTPEQIVRAAIEEDVDVIGISILSGSHMNLLLEINDFLHQYNITDIPFIAGGIIPAEDISVLKNNGVKKVFQPESSTSNIVEFIRNLIEQRNRVERSHGENT